MSTLIERLRELACGGHPVGGEAADEIESLLLRIARLEDGCSRYRVAMLSQIESAWGRMGNAFDPSDPGWFVCNKLNYDQWEALRKALFNEAPD